MGVAGTISKPGGQMDADVKFAEILMAGYADCLSTTAPNLENTDSLFAITASKHADGVTSSLRSELKKHRMLYSYSVY